MTIPTMRRAAALMIACAGYGCAETVDPPTGYCWRETPVRLQVEPSARALPGLMSDLAASIDTWAHACPAIPRVQVQLSTAGNSVRVDGSDPALQGALAVTIVRYGAASGTITESDVILSDHYPMGATDQPHAEDVWDLRSVLTHEVGHWLGLPEYTGDEPSSAMAEVIPPGTTEHRTPSKGDGARLCALYEAREDARRD